MGVRASFNLPTGDGDLLDRSAGACSVGKVSVDGESFAVGACRPGRTGNVAFRGVSSIRGSISSTSDADKALMSGDDVVR